MSDYTELLKIRAFVDLYKKVYADLNGVKPEVGVLQRQALKRTCELVDQAAAKRKKHTRSKKK